MDKKKTLLIVVAVVVVVLVAYFASRSLPTSNNQNPATNTNQQPGKKTDQGVVTPSGVVAASGTSPIANSGQVVTPQGAPVKLNVAPGTPDAPQQSNPIAKPADLPSKAVKLSISASGGWSPKEFTVSSGSAVTVAVTATDNQTHVFKFDDPSLDAVAIGIGPGETRAITFNAPKSGTYKFHCDVPGHSGRGEVGQMVVQ